MLCILSYFVLHMRDPAPDLILSVIGRSQVVMPGKEKKNSVNSLMSAQISKPYL